jgi:hypothetical protein
VTPIPNGICGLAAQTAPSGCLTLVPMFIIIFQIIQSKLESAENSLTYERQVIQ